MQPNRINSFHVWLSTSASYCNSDSYWQRHMYGRIQAYHHAHQSSNCQYYHINITSQYFLSTSHCHKAVTSRCSNIQTHCSETQSRCSNKQACCSREYQQLGLLSPSQLVAAKTSLAAASTLCLNQTEHEIHNSTYCSQFEFSHCDENPTRCCEYSQRQGLTNPSLLVAARITLAATSASCLK